MMKFKADSPLKRAGIVLVVTPLAILLLYAIGWNVKEKALFFFDAKTKYSYIEASEPPAEKHIFWVRVNYKHLWYKIDANCPGSEKIRKSKSVLFYPDCVVGAVSDESTSRQVWEFILDDFLKELFRTTLFKPLFVFFLLGVILFTGLPERIYKWIKTGKWERKKTTPKEGSKKPNKRIIRRIIYGFGVILLWSILLATLKRSGLHIGAIPAAISALFFLWLFAKVTGLNLGFGDNKKS